MTPPIMTLTKTLYVLFIFGSTHSNFFIFFSATNYLLENKIKQKHINFENDQSISFSVMFPADQKNFVSRKTGSKFRKNEKLKLINL